MLLLRGCEKNQEKKWKRWRANRKKTETQRQSVTISLVRNYHDERIAFIQFAIVHVFERETFSDTDIALATLTRSVAHCAAYQPSDKTIVVVECVSEKSIQAIEFFSFYCFCFLYLLALGIAFEKYFTFLSLNSRQTMYVWNERISMKLIRKKMTTFWCESWWEHERIDFWLDIDKWRCAPERATSFSI